MEQSLPYISICSLRIRFYNSKFILMATSLGTDAVVVMRVHCIFVHTHWYNHSAAIPVGTEIHGNSSEYPQDMLFCIKITDLLFRNYGLFNVNNSKRLRALFF